MAVSLSNVACTLGSKDSGHGRRARRVWSCRTVQQLPPRIAFEVERGGHIEELGLVSPTQRAVDGTTFAQKSTLYTTTRTTLHGSQTTRNRRCATPRDF